MSRASQDSSDLAIQETPRGFAVYAQESFGGVFGSDVNMSNANHGAVIGCDVGVGGLKRPIGNIGEGRIGSTKKFHKVTLYMTLLTLGDLVGNN